MRLLLLFLVATFVVGATADGWKRTPRPLAILAACVVFGAMFYSRRVL